MGHGQFGTVFKARMSGECVAVKIFLFNNRDSWQHELKIFQLPQMTHDSIVKFVGAYNQQTEFWLITAFHERGSLCDYLMENVISWDELCHIVVTMTQGLSHLHEELPASSVAQYKPSVAHRDFKSKNVLLKQDLTAVIADFGLAMVFEKSMTHEDFRGHQVNL